MTWAFFAIYFIALASNVAYGAENNNEKGKPQSGGTKDDVQIYADKECKKALPVNARRFEGDLLNKDEEITLYYFDNQVSSVEFNEAVRDTVLLAQLKKLATKADETGRREAKAPTCIPTPPYRLKYVRANLTITATGADEKSQLSFNIVTGPAEHWYLAFDLPVSSRKTLKYDQATKTLLPQDQNPGLYMSFNYSPEDIVESKNLWAAKLLFQVSQRPLDSVGIGFSRRLPNDVLGLGDFSSLSLFVGRFWTKQDAVTANGTPQLNQSTAQAWRAGISYDFNTGLPWVK